MGCVLSSVERPSSNSRLFDVYNIDDRGQERSPGKIEVGDYDLVLYQASRDVIRWPLRSLRRYGFDAELFSFESGRRCVTGPGIYAFKCSRAETLFDVLQESIIRAGQMEANRGIHVSPEPCVGLQSGTAPSNDWFPLQNLNHVTNSFDMTSSTNNYVNQSTTNQRRDYVNDASSSIAHAQSQTVKYAELKLLESDNRREDDDRDDEPEVFVSSSLFPSGPNAKCAYVNLPRMFDGAAGQSDFIAKGHQYMNIGYNPQLDASAAAALTYAQLDLFEDGPGDLIQPNPGGPFPLGSDGGVVEIDCSRSKPEVYAAIDFQRTRALNSRVDEELDEGFRKTRHNSTIETKSTVIN